MGIGESLKHLGYNSTSTTYLKEALKQPISNNDSKSVKVEKLEKAMALVYLGNYSQALDIANQVLRQNPTDFGA